MRPLLSIVIANYNYGRFLEEAIQSVVTQEGFNQCELIVIDGGSTDNSVKIIKKYASKITYWTSEKDNGQSNAFNKGFARASGKYLTWLNADDLMVAGALAVVLCEMTAHPECDWFTGNFYRFINETRKISEVGWGPHCYPKFLQRRDSPLVIFGPSSFFSRKIYETAGKIDEHLNYIMDTDLWLRFMKMGIRQRRIRCFCWAFRMHLASKTAEFGGHKLDGRRAQAMKAERDLVCGRIGYRMSGVLRFLVAGMRFFDGSAFRALWYRWTFTQHKGVRE